MLISASTAKVIHTHGLFTKFYNLKGIQFAYTKFLSKIMGPLKFT